ncbi:MAG: hypothetical protein NXI21_09505 [Alphaproteobacteria bacterium]|nr:hypothetical protein [Alphaproteobacteria bacterium]
MDDAAPVLSRENPGVRAVRAMADATVGPGLLHLDLTPERTAPGAFLVAVDLILCGEASAAGRLDLGVVAFFPPPAAGETRRFTITLPRDGIPPSSEPRAVSLSLRPAEPGAVIPDVRLRIDGATVRR